MRQVNNQRYDETIATSATQITPQRNRILRTAPAQAEWFLQFTDAIPAAKQCLKTPQVTTHG